MSTHSLPMTVTRTESEGLITEEVAQRIGVTESTVRRWMRDGELPATWTEPELKRNTWRVKENDVEAFITQRTQFTVDHVAAQLGQSYHQVWNSLPATDRAANRNGHAIRLSNDQIAKLHADAAHRARHGQIAIPVALAANRTHLAVVTIETLIRQGALTTTPSPNGTRIRYITLASLEAFEATRPAAPTTKAGDLVIPVSAVRLVLGITRPCMTHLVTSGQITATTSNRRQVITLTSALNYLAGHPTLDAEKALRANATPLPA